MNTPPESDIARSHIAASQPKKWRFVSALFAQVALVTAIFGVVTPDSIGYISLGVSLVCVTLAANAFLAE